MRKRHTFRPAAPDLLEDRVLLHGGIEEAVPVAAAVSVSTAADVFQPQMGRILTAAYVFGNHLSRNDALQIIANQTRNAFAAFRTGLNRAVDGLATSGDRNAFDADVTALCGGLAARYAEILSTSPRAQKSLVPFGQDALDGSGSGSLVSKLTALPINTSDASSLDASRSLAVGVMNQSLRDSLAALGTFDRRPNFPFTSTNSGGGTPTPTPTPTAAPATLNSGTFSPTRIDLTWAKVDAATGYKVERSSNGIDFAQVATTNAATITFSDTGLTPGTTYSYRVRASGAGGDSPPSPVTTAATVPLTLPDAPASFVLNPIQDPHNRGLAMHIHPHLTIIINGQQQTIPANLGLTIDASLPGGFSATPIHTHDTSGFIHVESTEALTLRLSDFFNVWSHYAGGQGRPVSDPSIVFNSQNILGHQVDATHTLTMTVNGQPSTAFEKQTLNDPDGSLFSDEGASNTQQIVIDYEPK